MRIKRLRIKGFRSIAEIDIELPAIAALVGPNNSGKSNVLLAIRQVLERDWVNARSFDLDDVRFRDENTDVLIEVGLDSPVPYQKLKAGSAAQVSSLRFEYKNYKIGEKKGTRRLESTCLDAKGKPAMVMKSVPKTGQQAQFEPVIGIPSEVKDCIPLIYIGTNRSLKEQLPNGRYSLLRILLADINKRLHDPHEVMTVQRGNTEAQYPRFKVFEHHIKQAMAALRTPDFEAMEQSIKTNALRQLGFDPDKDADKLDLSFAPFDTFEFYKSLDLILNEGGFRISASELGDGIQNALVLAILQTFEERRKKGAIILIEEPEMFLHPQMQRSLYKTIRKLGETNQVIYATHSPHFVSVPEYDEVRLVRKTDGGTTVVASSLANDAKRKLKLQKELDPERSELFFATKLLLVEGDTEKLAFPEYAVRLGLDLDKAGATIVEVGGKRNLMEFASIAKSFGIPVGIVYDEDSSDFRKEQKADEATYNAKLDGLAEANGQTRAWRFTAKYEVELRAALGEKNYQALCSTHGGTSKAIQARLIAADTGTAIPKKVEEILHWLVGLEPKGGSNG